MGLHIHSVGNAIIQTLSTSFLYLHNILHIPTITKNLISVSNLLVDNNEFIEFYDPICFIKDKNT